MLSEYKAFVAYGDKTLSSILATVKASLTLFTDETVASITSFDTIDFSEFRKRKLLYSSTILSQTCITMELYHRFFPTISK